MAARSSVGEWIKRYLKEENPRSKSLMVSAFGDSIAPVAPGIWLGDLIALMSPFGMSERLVRTSAFRLVDEGWLEARRDGRRSYYSLTPSGVRRIEVAHGHIYTPAPSRWDESWTVVLLPRNGDSHSDRLELRRELEWEGFATPVPGVMLHPAADHAALRRILLDRGVADRVVVLTGRAAEAFSSSAVDGLVAQYWNLADVEDRYGRFISRFGPLLPRLDPAALSPQQAFTLQTLLIHSFRRATLHDPRLPTPMVPPNWPGIGAYELCRQIYRLTHRLAERHLRGVMQDVPAPDQPPRLAEQSRGRFGGLD